MGRHSIDLANAKDIGVGGVGVYVPHGFEECNLDSEIELVITLPGRRSFSARGILRHQSSGEGDGFFGIEFTQVKDAARALIEKYISDFEGNPKA